MRQGDGTAGGGGAERVGAMGMEVDTTAAGAGEQAGRAGRETRRRRGKQAKMTSSQRKQMKKVKQRGRDG